MNKSVDNYLLEGCRRCPLGGTADCKVLQWIPELERLRTIVVECGLTEACKWGVPCYTFDDKNILLVSAFKAHCSISFFKGSLLNDTKNFLIKPGKNSQAVRSIQFTSLGMITKLESNIKTFIYEAIEVEKAGLKVNFKKHSEPIPEELEKKFQDDPILKSAFESLTPGRQRGYLLYFSAPKQAKTTVTRIEKCIGKILNGVGLNDKYKSKQ